MGVVLFMALINSKQILLKAKKNQKAIGAFNVLSLEMIQGVIDAAEEMNTPIILQISSGALRWARFEYIVPMAISAAQNSSVDVALHLDHAQDVELIKKAINSGFSSVMYDGSHFDLKQNIEESLFVKKLCNDNVQLEIEIGKVGGKEDDLVSDSNDIVTVEDAVDFYNKTLPDSLAIAFGTAHGKYKGEINLNFDIIKEASKIISAPLVMHGSSGIDFEDIKSAIKAGITKVNVGTDLLIVYNNAIREYLNKNLEDYDIRKINTAGIKAIKNKAIEYIKLFNS